MALSLSQLSNQYAASIPALAVTSTSAPGARVIIEEPLSVKSPNSIRSELKTEKGAIDSFNEYGANASRTAPTQYAYHQHVAASPAPGLTFSQPAPAASPATRPAVRMLSFTSPAPQDIEAASLALMQKKWTLLSTSFKSNAQNQAEMLMKQAASTAQLEELVQHLLMQLRATQEDKARLSQQLLAERAALEAHAEEQTRQRSTAEHRAAALMVVQESLAARLGAAHQAHEAQHAQGQAMHAQLQSLHEQFEAERQARAQAEQQLLSQQAECEQLQQSLEEQQLQQQELSDSKTALQAQLKAMLSAERELTDSLKDTHASINEQLGALREQVKDERSKRSAVVKRKNELAMQVQLLSQQLAAQAAQLTAVAQQPTASSAAPASRKAITMTPGRRAVQTHTTPMRLRRPATPNASHSSMQGSTTGIPRSSPDQVTHTAHAAVSHSVGRTTRTPPNRTNAASRSPSVPRTGPPPGGMPAHLMDSSASPATSAQAPAMPVGGARTQAGSAFLRRGSGGLASAPRTARLPLPSMPPPANAHPLAEAVVAVAGAVAALQQHPGGQTQHTYSMQASPEQGTAQQDVFYRSLSQLATTAAAQLNPAARDNASVGGHGCISMQQTMLDSPRINTSGYSPEMDLTAPWSPGQLSSQLAPLALSFAAPTPTHNGAAHASTHPVLGQGVDCLMEPVDKGAAGAALLGRMGSANIHTGAPSPAMLKQQDASGVHAATVGQQDGGSSMKSLYAEVEAIEAQAAAEASVGGGLAEASSQSPRTNSSSGRNTRRPAGQAAGERTPRNNAMGQGSPHLWVP